MKPFLLVLSAPSGGGKTTIAKMLLQGREDLGYSVSATTRPKRPDERNGRDYHFLSRDEFIKRRDRGEFLEWATYGGELYGTLKSEIEQIFAQERHAVLDVEIEGARQIRRNFPNSLLLFVLPPSAEALVQRLMGRQTEDPALMRERIMRAADELSAVDEYDYAILNEDLVVAVAQVAAILEAESWRVARQDTLPEFIGELKRDVEKAAEKIGRKTGVGSQESGHRDRRPSS